MPVYHHHAAVERGGTEDEFAREGVVVGDNRACEAALTETREFNRHGEVAPRSQRGAA